jgi:hypothetical protein
LKIGVSLIKREDESNIQSQITSFNITETKNTWWFHDPQSVIIIISFFLVSLIEFGDADAQEQDIVSNDTSALMECSHVNHIMVAHVKIS